MIERNERPKPPEPAPKIGDKRPHPTIPFLKQIVTGYSGDGSPVWRDRTAVMNEERR